MRSLLSLRPGAVVQFLRRLLSYTEESPQYCHFLSRNAVERYTLQSAPEAVESIESLGFLWFFGVQTIGFVKLRSWVQVPPSAIRTRCEYKSLARWETGGREIKQITRFVADAAPINNRSLLKSNHYPGRCTRQRGFPEFGCPQT